MADRNISMEGITARDEQIRRQMQRASDALLIAMIRELEGMGARHG